MENARTLDHRSPFVIDVRDLSRRPGSMLEVSRTIPAPADMEIAVIGVKQGSDLDVNLRLEAVMEGVFVSGSVEAEAVGECVRCLEEIVEDVEVQLAELFIYPERAKAAEDSGDDEEAEEVYELQEDLINLEPVLRDAVVMALPFQPVCSDDCLGLCSECGVRLGDPGMEEHHHEILDPRWKALNNLLPDDGADSGDADSQDESGAQHR